MLLSVSFIYFRDFDVLLMLSLIFYAVCSYLFSNDFIILNISFRLPRTVRTMFIINRLNNRNKLYGWQKANGLKTILIIPQEEVGAAARWKAGIIRLSVLAVVTRFWTNTFCGCLRTLNGMSDAYAALIVTRRLMKPALALYGTSNPTANAIMSGIQLKCIITLY